MFSLMIVCEGPTDAVLVKAAFDNHLDDYVVTVLQPELSQIQDQGPFGGGWKGVRAWCQQVRRQGGLHQVLARGDALVIHADADIADDPEIACRKDCPPASATTDAVRKVIKNWLDEDPIPDRTILCVPSKATDAWAFVALFPNDPMVGGIECRDKPESLLVGRKPRLVRKKGSTYKKNRLTYEQSREIFRNQWKTITGTCTEAARFDADLAAVVSGHSGGPMKRR